jgi:hypothetical protein
MTGGPRVTVDRVGRAPAEPMTPVWIVEVRGSRERTRPLIWSNQQLTNDIGESNANIAARTVRKKAKNGGPGRTRTSNQTVMSGLVSPESSIRIDVFRRVRARSFASVHGISVVHLWSVRHFPKAAVTGSSMAEPVRVARSQGRGRQRGAAAPYPTPVVSVRVVHLGPPGDRYSPRFCRHCARGPPSGPARPANMHAGGRRSQGSSNRLDSSHGCCRRKEHRKKVRLMRPRQSEAEAGHQRNYGEVPYFGVQSVSSPFP